MSLTAGLRAAGEAIFGKEIGRALAMPGRVPAIDLFRGLAITTVVLYHGGLLPYGYLGVDVFFVVSGLLIGQKRLPMPPAIMTTWLFIGFITNFS